MNNTTLNVKLENLPRNKSLHPTVPEDAIKAAPLTIAQRVLRTQSVPELDGRDTLLEAIRSASVSLKPKELRKVGLS